MAKVPDPFPPTLRPHSPTNSELESTMSVAAFKQKDGSLIHRVVVRNSDGREFVSDQSWPTAAAAYVALCEHLKELGVPDNQVKVSRVH